MRDARVRHEALDVGLHDRDQVADGHRDERQHPEQQH
jgi:hypothetical protein